MNQQGGNGKLHPAKPDSTVGIEAEYPAVRRYVGSRRVPAHDVDDVVQDTFLVFLEKEDHARPGSERSFLFGIAANMLRKYHYDTRRDAHHAALLQQDAEERTVQGSHSFVAAEEHYSLLRAAIAQLPPRMRQIVELVYSDGLTRAEVARRLGVTRSNISILLRRALRHLRTTLSEVPEV